MRRRHLFGMAAKTQTTIRVVPFWRPCSFEKVLDIQSILYTVLDNRGWLLSRKFGMKSFPAQVGFLSIVMEMTYFPYQSFWKKRASLEKWSATGGIACDAPVTTLALSPNPKAHGSFGRSRSAPFRRLCDFPDSGDETRRTGVCRKIVVH
ncbi:MAG: hypothetical protein M0009_03490 [Deltaproteobacteria bacterium]|nr:hypothetical protein [Deltaproteobacteria bacterium]